MNITLNLTDISTESAIIITIAIVIFSAFTFAGKIVDLKAKQTDGKHGKRDGKKGNKTRKNAKHNKKGKKGKKSKK